MLDAIISFLEPSDSTMCPRRHAQFWKIMTESPSQGILAHLCIYARVYVYMHHVYLQTIRVDVLCYALLCRPR